MQDTLPPPKGRIDSCGAGEPPVQWCLRDRGFRGAVSDGMTAVLVAASPHRDGEVTRRQVTGNVALEGCPGNQATGREECSRLKEKCANNT